MRIREEIRDDVAVLTVSGALMDGPEVAAFHAHIKQLILGGINKVVVDFSKVKWFGSSMLGVLTSSLITVRKEGGDLRLAGVTKRIESIIMVSQLSGLFRTLGTVDRAVASYTTQPPDPAPESSE